MQYTKEATGETPGHIIYLIDVSGSMDDLMPDTKKRKVEVVTDLLEEIVKIMLKRSRRRLTISSRYQIAVFTYGHTVNSDTANRFISVDRFAKQVPEFGDLKQALTNTKGAFEAAYKLLQETLPDMYDCPAPLVCNLTDGEYSKEYGDPTPIVQDIMKLSNPDGNVLVQNIFISEKPLLAEKVSDVKTWVGVQSESELQTPYAQALYRMSSPLPESYASQLRQETYQIKAGTPMLFPASGVEMLRLAFMTSTATPRQARER